MNARKLRYRVQAEHDALVPRIADALQAWQRAWMLEPVALEHRVVDLDAARAPDNEPWQLLGTDEGGAPALYFRLSEAPRTLAARWLGLPLSGVRAADARRELLSEALARRGYDALLEALASAALCTRAGAASDDDGWRVLARRWSGAILVRSSGHGFTVDWLMSGATVDRLVKRRAPVSPRARDAVVPLPEALAARKLHAKVELKQVALSLGDLAALQPGDVIALGHGLDMPLHVLSARNEADAADKLFDGFLVARDGRKSLKLVAEMPANLS